MARCIDDDDQTLVTLAWLAVNINPSDFSDNVLAQNIVFSELWSSNLGDGGPDYETLLELEDTYYVSPGVSSGLRARFDDWNKYIPPLDLYGEYSNPSIPMLLINGDLDPQTTSDLAQDAANNWNANIDGNNRYYVELPNVPHGVLLQSSITNYTDYSLDTEHDFETCGMYIMKSFIDNPYLSPDISCLNWLTPFDWKMETNISKEVSSQWLGTKNAWGEIEDIPSTTMEQNMTNTMEVDNAFNIHGIFALFVSFLSIFVCV